MDLVESVERLRTGLDFHLARHNILVSNLTQSETPGYKPVDLARSDFKKVLGVALAGTHEGHMKGTERAAGSSGVSFRVVRDKSADGGADGNGVDVDREAMKIATNQLRYDTVAQLTQSALADLAWAANDGRNV
jgi:flagellar basal-body rod protein FlgB